MSRRDELEALLPFYLNGTLDGADLAAVEEWLATDPAALPALEEAEAEFSGTAAANEAIRPPADALSRFSKALDAEAGPARARQPSALARLWDRLHGDPGRRRLGGGRRVPLALVLVQSVMEPGGRGGPVEIAGTGEQANMPFALVTFKPDARIADVSAFLRRRMRPSFPARPPAASSRSAFPPRQPPTTIASSALLLPSPSPTLCSPGGNRNGG